MDIKTKNRVFLSYAHENLEIVQKTYTGLKKRELDVWFDKMHLKPGSWKRQIEKAIPKCKYFVICISNAALKKTSDETPGFQDEELQQAYEIARVQPESSFAIVPVRIEICDRGDHRTTPYQQYDLFYDFEEGLDRLAVDLGGISLSDRLAKDTRSEDKKLFDNLLNKGMSLWHSKNYDAALKMFDACIETNVDKFLPLYCEVHLLESIDRFDKAIEVCEKAIKIQPDHAGAWQIKGNILRTLGQNEKAIKAYTRWLEIDSDNVQNWIEFGCFFSEIGRKKDALTACNKALEIDSDYADALHLKSLWLVDLGQHEEAIETYSKALEIYESEGSSHADHIRETLAELRVEAESKSLVLAKVDSV